jgi:hypothetical protein
MRHWKTWCRRAPRVVAHRYGLCPQSWWPSAPDRVRLRKSLKIKRVGEHLKALSCTLPLNLTWGIAKNFSVGSESRGSLDPSSLHLNMPPITCVNQIQKMLNLPRKLIAVGTKSTATISPSPGPLLHLF